MGPLVIPLAFISNIIYFTVDLCASQMEVRAARPRSDGRTPWVGGVGPPRRHTRAVTRAAGLPGPSD